jgi:hypothetical protein
MVRLGRNRGHNSFCLAKKTTYIDFAWESSGELVHSLCFARNTLWRISLSNNSSLEVSPSTKVDNLGLGNLSGLTNGEKLGVDHINQIVGLVSSDALELSDVHANISDVHEIVHVGELDITVCASRRNGGAVNAVGIHTCNRDLFSDWRDSGLDWVAIRVT